MGSDKMKHARILLIGAAASMASWSAALAQSQMGLCGFDESALQFRGSDIEQARCLLSHVKIGGRLDPPPRRLGTFLEAHVGAATDISRDRLRGLLRTENLNALADSVGLPISRARNNAPSAPAARYFVIHDTSQWLRGFSFPPNDADSLNGLGTLGDPDDPDSWVAHTFTNRRGEVFLAHDYSVPWRAVRLERNNVTHGVAKGLFLHNELNQPRHRDPHDLTGQRDKIAPLPGFTPQQYDRLALLYILASTRGGRWLIPAFHAVLDSGIDGGHDDPQNFDLPAWEAAIERRVAQLTNG